MANAKTAGGFDLESIKKGAQRVDNVRWWTAFDKGEFVIARLTKVEPAAEGERGYGKFYGLTRDGELFQSFQSAIIASALANVRIGNVVLIQYAGKRKHPNQPGQTIKDYEVFDLGTDFPDDAPSPDFDAIAERIARSQEDGQHPQ